MEKAVRGKFTTIRKKKKEKEINYIPIGGIIVNCKGGEG
jgi:hypothetical protein